MKNITNVRFNFTKIFFVLFLVNIKSSLNSKDAKKKLNKHRGKTNRSFTSL